MGLSAEASTEPDLDVALPDWTKRPLWERKLKLWANWVEKGCIAKRGRGGMYCGWGGHPCYYNGCPRRIFEEDAVADGIPQPVPTPDFVVEFKVMQKQLGRMQQQLKKSNARVRELEKEIES